MIKTYFTFLMISYYVQGEPLTTSILFPSYDGCSYSKAAMYNIIESHYDDVHIFCQGTNVVAKDYIKPMPRP